MVVIHQRRIPSLLGQDLEHRLRALKVVQDLVLPAVFCLEVDRPTSVQDTQWMLRLSERPVLHILGIAEYQRGRAEQLVVDG